ncbi:MarR family transcriptional regulator [Halieaceae bacterium IMCC14734]|uniref:MarR family transcriptional regulator n=1 Tax=Candidatus Litorirhabdus singularis TaxID=2518993 RepID=A0ABT3TEW3_9GAMM|nr:MarR family transcriptional regulator [Candidatus Litorirhabdus singularis]MCX2980345.1 MarR family transcriptional regulator [Candidatus Litorirhabdus singularis]
MSNLAQQRVDSREIWGRYRSNLPRHCIGVSRHLQTHLMHALHQQFGHTGLRLGFEPFIALIGAGGARPGELANLLCISKQACNQTINQIERAGYLQRQPDPADGRARLVLLTDRGLQLRAQGAELIGRYEAECGQLLGSDRFDELMLLLRDLYEGLQLPSASLSLGGAGSETILAKSITAEPIRAGEIGARLPRIADYMMRRLMQLTIARGHPGLKMSFGQVLSLIGLEGGKVGQMARVQQVSKQAISSVAAELEHLNYIERHPDPADARQQVLQFTTLGMQLLADSVQSVVQLELELSRLLGADRLSKLQRILADLYQGLHLEEEIFGPAADTTADLRLLAAQLVKQLGPENAASLASMLNPQQEFMK